MKSYTADSGYVYEYFFCAEPAPGLYEFDVSSDRKHFRRVTLHIDPTALCRCAGHDLTLVERFAVAKLALRDFLDSWDNPQAWPSDPVRSNDDQLAQILATLDLV